MKVNSRAALVVFLNLAGFALVTTSGLAGAGTDTVALSGDAAPGLPGVNFESIGYPVLINNSGQVVFRSVLTGTGVTTANNVSIWRDTTLVVRKSSAAPGLSGVNFGDLVSYAPVFNDNGQVAFHSYLTGAGVTTANDGAIWRDTTLVAREGNAAPGFSSVNFGTLFSPVLNNNGQVAFRSFLTGTGVTTANDDAIWRDTTVVAREGNAVPGLAGVNFGILATPVLNNNGQVAFHSYLTGTGVTTANDGAIWRDTTLVAREGNAAPGLAGANFGIIYFPDLNDSGQVAFRSILTGTGVTAANDQAIWRDASLVARKGNAAPGLSGVNFGHLLDYSPVLNNNGQVAFHSYLTGTGVTAVNDEAIWRDTTVVAREGNAAPGLVGVNFGTFTYPVLNNNGQVVFRSVLTGTGVTSMNDHALYLGDGIEQVKVVREGDSLAGSTVASLQLSGDALNDFGQVAYGASFANGTSGAFLFTPELHYRKTYSSNWDYAGNWTLTLNPAQVHDVYIDPTVSLTVYGPSAATMVKSLAIGGGVGIGTLQLNGGAITATNGVNVLATGVLTGDGVITSAVNNQGRVRAANIWINGGLTNSGIVEGSGRIHTALTNLAAGQVRVDTGETMLISGAGHSNAGRIEVIGGALEFNGALTNQASTGMITGRDATLRFNGGLTNAGSLALSFGTSDIFGDINNTGAIINSGAGRITFYDDVTNNGEVRTSSGGSTVFFGAVAGAGGYTGTGTVHFEGDLRPGTSPALVTVEGDMSLGLLSHTTMELGGLLRGSEYDAIDVAGTLSLGGSLDVVQFDLGSGLFTPHAGDSFDLFAADILQGSFSSLSFAALVDPGVRWNIAYLIDAIGTTDVVRLSVEPVPIPPAVWLLGSGLLGLIGVARRRSRRTA